MTLKKYIVYVLITLAVFQNCAVNPVTGKKEFMLLSKSQEVEMGKEADPDIVATYGLYDSPEMQTFIKKKGQEMASISHRPNLQYEFKILDSPIVNAFAVPGGYVYFTRGIMAYMNNEAEFAGVLGHEIGHIAARHSAKQYSRATVAQFGLALGTAISPKFAQFSDLAQTGASLLFLKFGRDAERQADELGVEYSTKISYDAHEMADFFSTLKRMEEASGQEMPVFLSTHPDPGERNKAVNKLANRWQKKTDKKNYIVNRNSYLKMIDGIVYGDDPRQGYVDDNTFYHPVLKFNFPVPSQWQIQNMPQQVTLAPEAGDAIMIFSLAPSKSLDEAASQLVEKYQLQTDNVQNIRIHGFDAKRIVAKQVSQNQTLNVMLYVIEDGGSVYYFIAATTPERISTYDNTFDQVATGFDRLTDPAKINVKPKRINVRQVNTNTTLRQVLKNFGVAEKAMDEHALINEMTLDETVPAGMMIKVIE